MKDADETAWLIEHGDSSAPIYWTGESWGKWSADHERACRFARRVDARKVSLCLGDPHERATRKPHRVTEHRWMP
jgi:hypothetical protein